MIGVVSGALSYLLYSTNHEKFKKTFIGDTSTYILLLLANQYPNDGQNEFRDVLTILTDSESILYIFMNLILVIQVTNSSSIASDLFTFSTKIPFKELYSSFLKYFNALNFCSRLGIVNEKM
jgi:hypothetical protein